MGLREWITARSDRVMYKTLEAMLRDKGEITMENLARVARDERHMRYLLDYLFLRFDVELSENEEAVRLKRYAGRSRATGAAK